MYTFRISTQERFGSWKVGMTNMVVQKLAHFRYSLCYHASCAVPTHTASFAAWISRIKEDAAVGGRVATKFSAAGRG